MNELMKKHKAAVAQVPCLGVPHRTAQALSSRRVPAQPLLLGGQGARVSWPSVRRGVGWIWGVWAILLQHSLLSQASRDLAQMNDLQAQLEEANKEKQELQEKVGTRGSLGRERVPGSVCGDRPELTG